MTVHKGKKVKLIRETESTLLSRKTLTQMSARYLVNFNSENAKHGGWMLSSFYSDNIVFFQHWQASVRQFLKLR